MQPRFRVVLIEHGYSSTQFERNIIEEASGEFIDAADQPLEKALELCETAQGILVRRLNITRPLLQRFRACKILVRYGVGVDNVDLEAATDSHIIVGHVPVYCLDEVSVHTVALLLAAVRHIVSTHRKMVRGAWDVNRADPVWRVAGKTLGIIGFGNIGRAVYQKLQGWGLRVLVHDPYISQDLISGCGATPASLMEICREADFISLHVPLLPETRHLIGVPQFEVMKPKAILINTSRGAVVDTGNLVVALDEKRLRYACLDVFEEEPLPEIHPLRTNPRVLLTDHMAWYSEESQIELQQKAAQEVVRVCTGGLPLAVANPEVLHRLDRWEEWTPSSMYQWQTVRSGKLRSGL